MILRPGTAKEGRGRRRLRTDRAGEVLVNNSGGGGGWGPALERDPEAVLADVREGYVSVEAATCDYGVVVDEATPSHDLAATATLRGMTSKRNLPVPIEPRPEAVPLGSTTVGNTRGPVQWAAADTSRRIGCEICGHAGASPRARRHDGSSRVHRWRSPRTMRSRSRTCRASSANTWLGGSKAAMDEIAAENGIILTEFDAQFDAALQTTQIQDAIAADRYDGMIMVALAGSAVIPDLEAAAEAGIKIVGLNGVIGDDFTTADPQTDALSASVMEPPLQRGERIGRLTLAACEGLDPCDVVYFYGIKGIPLDVAVKQGFDSVTEGSTVNVVAEGEGQYLGPDAGLAQMQGHPREHARIRRGRRC